MIALHTACIAGFLILISGCSSGERKGHPRIASETEQILLEFQQRAGLSDDELASAVQRWLKVDRAFRESVDKGLTTEEEIHKMFMEMPRTIEQLDRIEDGMLKEDRMAAAVAFSALRLLQDGKPEEAIPIFRDVIARYCRELPDSPAEPEAGFLEKVERLAESDPDLKRLLEKD